MAQEKFKDIKLFIAKANDEKDPSWLKQQQLHSDYYSMLMPISSQDEDSAPGKTSITSILLQISLVCLILAGGILVIGTFIYGNDGFNGLRYKECSNYQLYMELGYNLGSVGPELTASDLYDVFLRTVVLKNIGNENNNPIPSPKYKIEDECKEILLESYRIGLKIAQQQYVEPVPPPFLEIIEIMVPDQVPVPSSVEAEAAIELDSSAEADAKATMEIASFAEDSNFPSDKMLFGWLTSFEQEYD